MASTNADKNISRLRAEIERHLDWGDVSSWHSKMFDELSEKVFASTNVLLSVPTLKRFFGVVNHEGAPSITTLDALSQFIGKENWRVFKTTGPIRRKKERVSGKSIYVTIGFVLALVTISLISNKRPEVIINTSAFAFSSEVLSNEYPNSVVFNFKIPPTLRTDSLHIQQYWDPTKTVLIKRDQTQATGIYYYPGYFRAKLMADGQSVLEHDLFLKSNGWLGMVDYEPIPKYFEPVVQGSSLSYPNEIIEEVSQLDQPVVTTFHYIDDLGAISGDNFTLETTIKNVFDDRWAVCHRLGIYFIGTTGAFIVPFSKVGCSSDNNLMLNDVYLRGKEHDLSSLSADFSNTVDLKISVIEKKMTVSISGTEVYTQDYNDSMGELVGLRFRFEGLGEVTEFQLYDQRSQLVPLQ